ncbi:MAG: sensor histidine kinase [Actinomycetota bacterium]|nr:sensor histidine kinase [Actinomycetota bacterium]
MDIERAPVAIPIGRRAASTIAWLLCGSTLALVACAVVLASLNRYGEDLTYLVSPASAALVGGLIASRRPANPVGWFILGHALCFSLGEFSRQYAIYGFLTEPGSLPFARAAVWPAYWVWFPGLVLMFSLLPLYFPNGRLLSPRWRPAVWLAVFVALVAAGIGAFQPNDLEAPGLPNPLGIEALRPFVGVFLDVALPALWLILGLASVASLLVRFRRSRGEERQKIKWIGYAAVLMIAHIPLDLFLLQPLAPAAAIVLGNVFLAIPWAAIAVAVLRHRLYDIDLVINRTLVYGALTACVVGIYVLVVGYLGTLLRVDDNLAVSLFAAGVVAVLFAPLRDRLQRVVNRLMYGERDEPYAVVSRLGQRLEATLAPEDVLLTIVETVREALKLPYAAIALTKNGASTGFAASVGKAVETPLRLPLAYQGEPVGELLLGPRGPGETFGLADMRLLEGLARQAGVAAHAVRLTTDLQRSRERLVATREEERRRLRRDLHDGVGPRLAALMLELETAADLVAKDPEASALMTRLSGQARETIADVRRAVHALRPPALDELGLVGALREAADQCGRAGVLEVSVEAPAAMPPLPAAVEVACYLIAQEAMTNVARHAGASNCRVRVTLDEEAGALLVEVEDDGRGIGEADKAGVGTSSMRERAEELGGRCVVGPSARGSGTLVRALLPLPYAETANLGEE